MHDRGQGSPHQGHPQLVGFEGDIRVVEREHRAVESHVVVRFVEGAEDVLFLREIRRILRRSRTFLTFLGIALVPSTPEDVEGQRAMAVVGD